MWTVRMLLVCVNMHVFHVSARICLYIYDNHFDYTYVDVHLRTYIHIRANVHTCIYLHIHAYVHIHAIHTYTCIHAYTCIPGWLATADLCVACTTPSELVAGPSPPGRTLGTWSPCWGRAMCAVVWGERDTLSRPGARLGRGP
jgi:hypothetical protein